MLPPRTNSIYHDGLPEQTATAVRPDGHVPSQNSAGVVGFYADPIEYEKPAFVPSDHNRSFGDGPPLSLLLCQLSHPVSLTGAPPVSSLHPAHPYLPSPEYPGMPSGRFSGYNHPCYTPNIHHPQQHHNHNQHHLHQQQHPHTPLPSPYSVSPTESIDVVVVAASSPLPMLTSPTSIAFLLNPTEEEPNLATARPAFHKRTLSPHPYLVPPSPRDSSPSTPMIHTRTAQPVQSPLTPTPSLNRLRAPGHSPAKRRALKNRRPISTNVSTDLPPPTSTGRSTSPPPSASTRGPGDDPTTAVVVADSLSPRSAKTSPSHKATGPNEKRHWCSHAGCSAHFRRLEHLRRHNLIHTNEKPHRCTVPGCDKRFARRDNLSQHIDTHKRHVRHQSVAEAPGFSRHPVLLAPAPIVKGSGSAAVVGSEAGITTTTTTITPPSTATTTNANPTFPTPSTS